MDDERGFAVRLVVKAQLLTVSAMTDHRFVTIPAGALIQCFDDLHEPGFVRVSFDGEDLLAFTRDIRERTEALKTDHRTHSWR